MFAYGEPRFAVPPNYRYLPASIMHRSVNIMYAQITAIHTHNDLHYIDLTVVYMDSNWMVTLVVNSIDKRSNRCAEAKHTYDTWWSMCYRVIWYWPNSQAERKFQRWLVAGEERSLECGINDTADDDVNDVFDKLIWFEEKLKCIILILFHSIKSFASNRINKT